jgi:hypothetical protein
VAVDELLSDRDALTRRLLGGHSEEHPARFGGDAMPWPYPGSQRPDERGESGGAGL